MAPFVLPLPSFGPEDFPAYLLPTPDLSLCLRHLTQIGISKEKDMMNLGM